MNRVIKLCIECNSGESKEVVVYCGDFDDCDLVDTFENGIKIVKEEFNNVKTFYYKDYYDTYSDHFDTTYVMLKTFYEGDSETSVISFYDGEPDLLNFVRIIENRFESGYTDSCGYLDFINVYKNKDWRL